MNGSNQFKELAALRGSIYELLSELYATPLTVEAIEALNESQEIPAGFSFSESVNALIAEVRAFKESDGAINDLTAEHTRLFVLPSGIRPYEAYYLDENRRVGGRITAGVKSFYEYAAAQLTHTLMELPDHMGVELEFMKFLCAIEEQFWQAINPEGLRTNLQLQNQFLTEHLLKWHRAVAGQLRDCARMGIYRALADLTVDFLEADKKLIPELLEEIDSERRTSCASVI